MQTIGKLGFAAALLLGTAQAASAGVITETQTVGPSSSITNDTFSFNGYTATAATDSVSPSDVLTGVEIIVTETISGNMSVTNLSTTNPTSGHIGVVDSSSVASSLFSTVGLTNPSAVIPETLAASGTTGTVPLTGTVDDDIFLGPLTGFLGGWTATGNDTSLLNVQFSPNTVQINSNTDGTLSVEALYTYSAPGVAEPASMAILASGLLAMGMIRRRRNG